MDLLMEATGFKMGPFKLMDLIGNDINYSVSVSIYEQLNNQNGLNHLSFKKKKWKKMNWEKKLEKGITTY